MTIGIYMSQIFFSLRNFLQMISDLNETIFLLSRILLRNLDTYGLFCTVFLATYLKSWNSWRLVSPSHVSRTKLITLRNSTGVDCIFNNMNLAMLVKFHKITLNLGIALVIKLTRITFKIHLGVACVLLKLIHVKPKFTLSFFYFGEMIYLD